MPSYTRAFQPGGTFFLTFVTAGRHPILTLPSARSVLRAAIALTQRERPFEVVAICLLPDHLHCIWKLPKSDSDFSTRVRLIKSRFSIGYRASGACEPRRNNSRLDRRERGYWQRRFWEHDIRNEAELYALCDYIHFNPVKHGHVKCPHAWPYSSFERFVNKNRYASTWNCYCHPNKSKPPNFESIAKIIGE